MTPNECAEKISLILHEHEACFGAQETELIDLAGMIAAEIAHAVEEAHEGGKRIGEQREADLHALELARAKAKAYEDAATIAENPKHYGSSQYLIAGEIRARAKEVTR